MKSNMQIIYVNAAIIILLCRAHIVILFFYFSMVGNVKFYFIKLVLDMLHWIAIWLNWMSKLKSWLSWIFEWLIWMPIWLTWTRKSIKVYVFRVVVIFQDWSQFAFSLARHSWNSNLFVNSIKTYLYKRGIVSPRGVVWPVTPDPWSLICTNHEISVGKRPHHHRLTCCTYVCEFSRRCHVDSCWNDDCQAFEDAIADECVAKWKWDHLSSASF